MKIQPLQPFFLYTRLFLSSLAQHKFKLYNFEFIFLSVFNLAEF